MSVDSNSISSNSDSGGGVLCTICYEKYDQSDDVCVSKCGHVFHNDCLQDWLKGSSNCPICRMNNPSYFKLFLNFEENTQKPINTASTEITNLKKLDMSEYENLLYEVGIYREEIDELTKELAVLKEKLATQELDSVKKDVDLASNDDTLTKQLQRTTKLEESIQSVRRSIMENDTYENFVQDFINIINDLEDTDVNAHATADSDENGACSIRKMKQ